MKFLIQFILLIVFEYQVNCASVASSLQVSANNNGLLHHNKLRAKHGCASLVLDSTLTSAAQLYAENLAAKNLFQHSNDALTGKYGENLYYACKYPTTPDIANSTIAASDSWYNEISLYDYTKPGFTTGTGHFTALVWKATTKVGFGVALGTKPSGTYIFNCVYVVANYLTPGNVNTAAYFTANVPKLI